jgi:hypothetical protein
MTTDLSSRNLGLSDGPARVDLLLSLEPPQQNRLSVFLRWLLALPHFFVLEIIGVVAIGGAIGGWFAALVTGRLPRGLQKFLVGYLRYSVNVDAYSTLLTNKWPTINFEPQPDSMVDVDISQVGLNRLAVFGRLVLMIPALVVSNIIGFGVYPCLFTMWVVGSITGKVPRPLHQAVATLLRFQFRFLAYMLLVTPLQPFSGMLGDGAVASNAGDGPEFGSSEESAGTWRIVTWARRLIIVTLVIGLIGWALDISFGRPTFTTTKSDSALFMTVSNSYNASVTELNIIVETFSTCTAASCISAAIEGAGDTHLYQATLALEKAAPYPSGVSSDLQKYIVSLIDVQKDINAVAKATTIAQQRGIVSGKVELDVGNLTYRGIEILIYLGEQPNFSGMRFQW